ncbi:MAG: hypothetical protein ACI9IV_000433, partial [Paracoccaceae bacterium]
HPTLLLRDLGATISVELVRHLQHPQEDRLQQVSVERGSMQQRQTNQETADGIAINYARRRLMALTLRPLQI